jgi:hypothetical protein
VGDRRFGGMSIVAVEHFNGTDVSIGAQLANIKAANPDVLLGATVGTATGTLLRGLKDACAASRTQGSIRSR